MRLVFAGTGAFAVPTLMALQGAGHTIALVVTQPDRPAGRGLRLTPSPVKRAAESLPVPVFQPERIREPEATAYVLAAEPEALIVAAYGQILPAALLSGPRLGAINVHASLLPRHRGPAPIAWAILSGDAETGVTIMRMDAGVDTGPILAQSTAAIGPAETAPQLEVRLAELGSALIVETLLRVASGTVSPVPQPEAGATRARRLTSADGTLAGLSPVEIDRRVRALTPDPGCWAELRGSRVKILTGHLAPATESDANLVLGAADETAYVVDELQPPGRRPMSAAAWQRGHR